MTGSLIKILSCIQISHSFSKGTQNSHPSIWRYVTDNHVKISFSCTYFLVFTSQAKVADVVSRLSKCAPLVFAGEVRTLQEELAKASLGQGFLLMGGDCAEAFNEFSVNHVRDTFRVMLQMSLVMSFGGAMPIIKVGRMAGQFAKPRSEPDETIDGVTLPSYRGDIINGDAFTEESRTHNPERMMAAYHQSAQTLNILRAFSTGTYDP